MGAGQSKSETVFSRYPAESEIFKDIKLTPAVIERIATHEEPTPSPPPQIEEITAFEPPPQPEINVEQLKEEIRSELEGGIREKVEVEIRAELEDDYYKKLAEIAEIAEQKREEKEAEIAAVKDAETAAVNADLEKIENEREMIRRELEGQLESANHERNIALERVDQAIEEANKEALAKIRDAENSLASHKQEIAELQQRETQKLLERTKVIFDSRVTETPICPEIESQLTQCYRENQSKSLLCAELVRQYKQCLVEEKDRYFSRRISHEDNPQISAESFRLNAETI